MKMTTVETDFTRLSNKRMIFCRMCKPYFSCYELFVIMPLLSTIKPSFKLQVFDSPTVSVLVGSRVRRRLDAHSIVKLLQTFGAPFGIPLIVKFYLHDFVFAEVKCQLYLNFATYWLLEYS